MTDERIDFSHKIFDAGKGAAANRLLSDYTEPALHEVEPGSIGRCEVDMKARPAGQPDGAYRLRRVYLEGEDGRDVPIVDAGRWHAEDLDGRIVLLGLDDGPIRLEARGADALRLLDRQGQPIESMHDYELVRTPEVDRIADKFPMIREPTR
jgi:hypothetical protein